MNEAIQQAIAALKRRHAARVARRAAERRAAAHVAHADALRVVSAAAHHALDNEQARLVVDPSHAYYALPTIRLQPAAPDAAPLEVVADAETTYLHVAHGHLHELMQRDLQPRHHELALCVAAVIDGAYVEERKPWKLGQQPVMTFTTTQGPIVVKHFGGRDADEPFGRWTYGPYRRALPT